MPRFLIFGTGAVGGYYGGMLAKASHDVTFIARGENFKALQENGLTLIRDENKEIFPIKVFNDSSDLGIFDFILICTKSLHTEDSCKSIKNNVGENTTIASLQNGIENEEIIAKFFGEKKVIGTLAFVASKLREPGVVYQFGYNGLVFGEMDKTQSERVNKLCEIFKNAGVDTKNSPDIEADMWNKLVWNASFNPISVLYGLTVDEILNNAETLDLLKKTMIEVRDVAISLGINIRPDTVEYNIDRSFYYKGFKTSMLQDFERGRPIELEGLVGVVIRKAKIKNIKVPNIENIYNKLKQKSK